MKLAIIGSRSFNDYDYLEYCIQEMVDSPILLVVSGGAKGTDSLAEQFADNYGIPKLIINADWKQHGRKAGMLRNPDIVEASDKVLAFWDGISKGTANTISIAKHNNKLLGIVPV